MSAFLNYLKVGALALKYYFLNETITDEVIRRWVDELCGKIGIEINCSGEFYDDRFVLLANHRSFFDIPAIYKCSNVHLIWLAKRELFNTPIIGHALRELGGVAVDRYDDLNAARAVLKLIREFKEGAIVIFPYGSRINKSKFHKGGIFLAKRKNLPIYLVKIENTERVVPVGKMALYPGRVNVEILDRIDPNCYSEEELVKLVKDKIDA